MFQLLVVKRWRTVSRNVAVSAAFINKVVVLDREFLPLYFLNHEGPLHDMTGMWCATSATRFIGHIFFWDYKLTPICYAHYSNTYNACPLKSKACQRCL